MGNEESLLEELNLIRDAYKLDVKQFSNFMKERQLPLVEAFMEFSQWLNQAHEGKNYSSATINRKIAAVKSRIRYAFKHSSAAEDLRKNYQLEDVLKAVKPKPIEVMNVQSGKVLSIEEVEGFIQQTKDITIKLMALFLVGTGVRISEMLAIRLSDLQASAAGFFEVRVVGKGHKERIVYVKTSLIERVQAQFKGIDFLFEHHGKNFSRISVTNRIKYESLKTIGREVTAHQLRHTWAVIQLRRGKDLKAVAAVLGHTDPGWTARMYSEKKLKPDEAFLEIKEAGLKRTDRDRDLIQGD